TEYLLGLSPEDLLAVVRAETKSGGEKE
ncbi:hypothetical protein LCGC14_2086610, partial [marine sediment metagenome]